MVSGSAFPRDSTVQWRFVEDFGDDQPRFQAAFNIRFVRRTGIQKLKWNQDSFDCLYVSGHICWLRTWNSIKFSSKDGNFCRAISLFFRSDIGLVNVTHQLCKVAVAVVVSQIALRFAELHIRSWIWDANGSAFGRAESVFISFYVRVY